MINLEIPDLSVSRGKRKQSLIISISKAHLKCFKKNCSSTERVSKVGGLWVSVKPFKAFFRCWVNVKVSLLISIKEILTSLGCLFALTGSTQLH